MTFEYRIYRMQIFMKLSQCLYCQTDLSWMNDKETVTCLQSLYSKNKSTKS